MHDLAMPLSMFLLGAVFLCNSLELARRGGALALAMIAVNFAACAYFAGRLIWDFKILVPVGGLLVRALGWIGFAMLAAALVLMIRNEHRRRQSSKPVNER